MKKIVCLGGGIGTVNLVKGLKAYTKELAIVVSTADDGGSAGRLRRLYNVPPPGDIVSCIAALSSSKNPEHLKLITYRFPGDRYGKDGELSGHKLGNLMLVAGWNQTGDLQKGIMLLQQMFQSVGTIFPATTENISLSAITADGTEVNSEENIDRGKYNGNRVLEKVFIHPDNPLPTPGVLEALDKADGIIAGPGDLYTTILPVLLIPQIREALQKLSVPKIFIVNVANKPFETKNYSVSDFVTAIKKHLGTFPFTKVIVNNNHTIKIPEKYKYTFVTPDKESKNSTEYTLVTADLVDESFPLYHDSQKLASLVVKEI